MHASPAVLRRTLWLIWLVVAFGALNVFGPSRDSWWLASNSTTASSRVRVFETLMLMLRDDNDIDRYFAYAQATLGRPYAADLARPPDLLGVEGEPDLSRIASPRRPLVPWRGFFVEYPPGMMIPVLAPALVTSDGGAYFRLFNLEMEIALTLAVWLAVRTADRLKLGAGTDALAYAILLTLALGVVAVRRYDPCVALAIAFAVHELARGKAASSGVALGAAIALKGVPILLAPIFAMYALSRGDSRGLGRGAAGCVLTVGLSGLVFAAIAGPHMGDLFAYHGARPLEIQTVYSGLLILARSFDPALLSVKFSFGSYNGVSPAEPALRTLSTALLIVGVVASWFAAYRRLSAARDEADRLLAAVEASLACLVAFITLGKVFSPQYCVWLVPLAAIAARSTSGASRGFLLLGFLLAQTEYPFLFRFIYAILNPWTSVLIFLRTLCLWLFVTTMLKTSSFRAKAPSSEKRQAA
jgi:hypothetical protein